MAESGFFSNGEITNFIGRTEQFGLQQSRLGVLARKNKVVHPLQENQPAAGEERA